MRNAKVQVFHDRVTVKGIFYVTVFFFVIMSLIVVLQRSHIIAISLLALLIIISIVISQMAIRNLYDPVLCLFSILLRFLTFLAVFASLPIFIDTDINKWYYFMLAGIGVNIILYLIYEHSKWEKTISSWESTGKIDLKSDKFRILAPYVISSEETSPIGFVRYLGILFVLISVATNYFLNNYSSEARSILILIVTVGGTQAISFLVAQYIFILTKVKKYIQNGHNLRTEYNDLF